jgi:hypothetical protein
MNPPIDKRRLFLQPYVNTIVTVEGWCQHHGYVPTPNGRRIILTTVIRNLLVTLPDGLRREIDHVHVRHADALRGVRPGTRVRFQAHVREYRRKDGSISWSLSWPWGVAFVGEPIAMRAENQDERIKVK